jgi:hypothetical protein
MNLDMSPLNVELLLPTNKDVMGMKPITVTDVFESKSSRNFHAAGLFSVDIFGKVGSENRNRIFSYIDLKVSVMHPILFKTITDLKSYYRDILSGKSYAIFDKVTKDFVLSNPAQGNTGYNFFMSHLKDLEFERKDSIQRDFKIDLIYKYRDKNNGLFDKLVVMPAGLRDFVFDENGRPTEGEINALYRKVLSLTTLIANVNVTDNIDFLDSVRFNIQLAINNIYNYIINLVNGKSKLILGKWASRKIFNGTSNVITSHVPVTTTLHGPTTVTSNQTVVGLYQYLRAILPLAVKNIRDGFLSQVFPGPNTPAVLVNKDYHKELVTLDPSYYDEWMTYEGIEKQCAHFGDEFIRHLPLKIGNYFLGLTFLGSDDTVKLFQDIDDIPEELKTDGKVNGIVQPMSFVELMYLSVFHTAKDTPGYVTRYPIAGYGSVYPCYFYLKTTNRSEQRKILNDVWSPSGEIANEFPLRGESFFDSMSPSPTHIGRLSADRM